jgi:hypothetical protein
VAERVASLAWDRIAEDLDRYGGALTGEGVTFAVHQRPVEGARGYYRVNLRHGVSRLRSGERYTLGVIFHDAK